MGSTPVGVIIGLITSLVVAIGGLVNSFISKREVDAKKEASWMTLTKESTDLVLDRLQEQKDVIEEQKKEIDRLTRENRECKQDMAELKRWLLTQGIRVPNPPTMPGIG